MSDVIYKFPELREQMIEKGRPAGRRNNSTILMEEHDKEGQAQYKKRWDSANVGWGSSENTISSKVYGKRPMVLTSTIDRKGRVSHEHTDY